MEPNKILKTDYLDILYEGRNKKYGSYELRREYSRRALFATAGIVALAVLLGATPFILRAMEKKKPVEVAANLTPVKLEAPPPMDETKPPPPPPPPIAEPPPPVKPTVKFTPPEIKPNEEVKEDEKPPEMAKEEAVAGPTTAAGDPNGIDPGITEPGTGNGPPVVVEEDPNKIFQYVEQQPQFNGDLNSYLSRNLRYSDADREAQNEGRVTVEFVVNVDGSIVNVKVARSSGHPTLDKEAVRVVSAMPAWTPGKQQGRAVRAMFALPVTFRLD